jgi:hypothetical protein
MIGKQECSHMGNWRLTATCSRYIKLYLYNQNSDLNNDLSLINLNDLTLIDLNIDLNIDFSIIDLKMDLSLIDLIDLKWTCVWLTLNGLASDGP